MIKVDIKTAFPNAYVFDFEMAQGAGLRAHGKDIYTDEKKYMSND